jgi:hypothetical protein
LFRAAARRSAHVLERSATGAFKADPLAAHIVGGASRSGVEHVRDDGVALRSGVTGSNVDAARYAGAIEACSTVFAIRIEGAPGLYRVTAVAGRDGKKKEKKRVEKTLHAPY